MGLLDDPFGLDKIGGKPSKPKSKRNTISKTVWETTKRTYGNKCVLCGKTEKAVGELQKAHIKAASKGGTQVLPMCPTCHRKFDTGKLTDTELKKLGLTRAKYNRMIPKSGKRKKKSTSSKSGDIFGIGSDPFSLSDSGGKKGRKKEKDDEPWRLW
jgi:hypothetical protein